MGGKVSCSILLLLELSQAGSVVEPAIHVLGTVPERDEDLTQFFGHYLNYLWVWAKSPVALQMGHTNDLSTGQVTRPQEFFNLWLLY